MSDHNPPVIAPEDDKLLTFAQLAARGKALLNWRPRTPISQSRPYEPESYTCPFAVRSPRCDPLFAVCFCVCDRVGIYPR